MAEWLHARRRNLGGGLSCAAQRPAAAHRGSSPLAGRLWPMGSSDVPALPIHARGLGWPEPVPRGTAAFGPQRGPAHVRRRRAQRGRGHRHPGEHRQPQGRHSPRNTPITPRKQVHNAEVAAVVTSVIGGVIAVGLWLWMAWANGRGRRWARIVATVFFAINTLDLIASVARIHAVGCRDRRRPGLAGRAGRDRVLVQQGLCRVLRAAVCPALAQPRRASPVVPGDPVTGPTRGPPRSPARRRSSPPAGRPRAWAAFAGSVEPSTISAPACPTASR